jgi:hypothetical protein
MHDTEYKLIINFLKRNYPIMRIKDKTRFKRAIVLDNGSIYFLSDEKSHIKLRNNLLSILKLVFYCRDEIAKQSVKQYLNL